MKTNQTILILGNGRRVAGEFLGMHRDCWMLRDADGHRLAVPDSDVALCLSRQDVLAESLERKAVTV